MSFENKLRGDDDDEASDVASGAPPSFDFDFDPNDPDVVKVHYNLTGWTFDQRAELAEMLAEHGVPHQWEGEELVVPEVIEDHVDGLFDALEKEIGPFPVTLVDDQQSTEFGLDEWPVGDMETLKQALVEAEIPHRWEGRTLLVSQDAEAVVDDLLDAIEEGNIASLDEDKVAPDGALHSLYLNGDRLARDPAHANARSAILDLVPELAEDAPPFGMANRAWETIVAAAKNLVVVFEKASEPEVVAEAASELKLVCRPYV
jgi:hypothetical protein